MGGFPRTTNWAFLVFIGACVFFLLSETAVVAATLCRRGDHTVECDVDAPWVGDEQTILRCTEDYPLLIHHEEGNRCCRLVMPDGGGALRVECTM